MLLGVRPRNYPRHQEALARRSSSHVRAPSKVDSHHVPIEDLVKRACINDAGAVSCATGGSVPPAPQFLCREAIADAFSCDGGGSVGVSRYLSLADLSSIIGLRRSSVQVAPNLVELGRTRPEFDQIWHELHRLWGLISTERGPSSAKSRSDLGNFGRMRYTSTNHAATWTKCGPSST